MDANKAYIYMYIYIHIHTHSYTYAIPNYANGHTCADACAHRVI